MLDVSHKEPLALILTGVLLHLWSPRCFSFFRKRRCLYVHKQRAVRSGGVLQNCERKSWKQLHLLMVPARKGV